MNSSAITDAGVVRTKDVQQAEDDEVDALSGGGVPTKDAGISHPRFG